MMPDNPGFKIAHHYHADTADPDTVERGLRAGDEERGRARSPGRRTDTRGRWAAPVHPGLPLYQQPGHEFHHRPASAPRPGGAGVRVQRAWVQVRHRGGGGAGRPGDGGENPASHWVSRAGAVWRGFNGRCARSLASSATRGQPARAMLTRSSSRRRSRTRRTPGSPATARPQM